MNSHHADILRSHRMSVLFALPPHILGLGITRQSHHPFPAPRTRHLGLESRPVTAPQSATQHGRGPPSAARRPNGTSNEGAAPGKGRIVRHRSLLVLTTVITTGALTLTACGSRDEAKTGGDKSGGSKTVVVIGVDAPSPARSPPSARASRTPSTSRPRRPTRTTRSRASSSRSRPSTTRPSRPPARPTPPSSSATRT